VILLPFGLALLPVLAEILDRRKDPAASRLHDKLSLRLARPHLC
jgi:hypothetical protein